MLGVFGQRYDSAGHRSARSFRSQLHGEQPTSRRWRRERTGLRVVWSSFTRRLLLGVFGSATTARGRRPARISGQQLHEQQPDQSGGGGGSGRGLRRGVAEPTGGQLVRLVWARYDSAGHTGRHEFQVTATRRATRPPAGSGGADGASWWHGRAAGTAAATGVFGQRYDSAGQPVGTEFRSTAPRRATRLSRGSGGADGAFVWRARRPIRRVRAALRQRGGSGHGVSGQQQHDIRRVSPGRSGGSGRGLRGAWNALAGRSGPGVFGQRFGVVRRRIHTPTVTITPTLTPTPLVASCRPSVEPARLPVKAQLQLNSTPATPRTNLKGSWQRSAAGAGGLR